MKNLEIRILKGHHEGAQCPIEAGALIGSDPTCDIVLMDTALPACAARLQTEAEGWTLIPEGVPAPESPSLLAFNTAAILGATWMTVCTAEDPWLDTESLEIAPYRFEMGWDSDATESDTTITEATHEGEDSSAAPLTDSTTDSPSSVSTARAHALAIRQKHRRRTTWIGATLFILLIGVGGTVAALSSNFFAFRRTGPSQAQLASLKQVQRTLTSLGLGHQLNASLLTNGTVTVTGWVPDIGVKNNLSTALAKIWPAPLMQVDDKQSTANALHERLHDLHMALFLDYPSPGTLKIQGIAATDADRAIALQRLAEDQDDIKVKAVEILSAAEVRTTLSQAIQATHLPPITPHWKAGVMTIRADYPEPLQRENLSALIALLNKRYLNVFSLVKVESVLGSANMPFRIYSVVGGPQPWVVLENGTKLVVGGTYKDYLLKSIEDSRVVFERKSTGQNATVIAR